MKKHLVLGECKWIRERGKANMLQDLIEKKAPKVIPASGNWLVYFLGFSREGWNEIAVDYARKITQELPEGANWKTVGISLVSLDDLDSDLYEWSGT